MTTENYEVFPFTVCHKLHSAFCNWKRAIHLPAFRVLDEIFAKSNYLACGKQFVWLPTIASLSFACFYFLTLAHARTRSLSLNLSIWLWCVINANIQMHTHTHTLAHSESMCGCVIIKLIFHDCHPFVLVIISPVWKTIYKCNSCSESKWKISANV